MCAVYVFPEKIELDKNKKEAELVIHNSYDYATKFVIKCSRTSAYRISCSKGIVQPKLQAKIKISLRSVLPKPFPTSGFMMDRFKFEFKDENNKLVHSSVIVSKACYETDDNKKPISSNDAKNTNDEDKEENTKQKGKQSSKSKNKSILKRLLLFQKEFKSLTQKNQIVAALPIIVALILIFLLLRTKEEHTITAFIIGLSAMYFQLLFWEKLK
ncbi:motile sperm domain-containing protein [Anaeramoeba flamelloides]|uniref:Motile sperm domain-containing protein n=1 Tax=Anaeramoeba flamelloides TaxID=1746091 RepID=A0AAV7Y3K6_9EUKA|nr:motile sperm domain-containing protein [Anaeramoeba flamelloides]KAJ6234657.1 motile sperm domain-containing protein [Anaeramoeba flamelloides]